MRALPLAVLALAALYAGLPTAVAAAAGNASMNQPLPAGRGPARVNPLFPRQPLRAPAGLVRADWEKPSKKKKEPVTDRSKTTDDSQLMNRVENRINSLRRELTLYFKETNQNLNQILELQDHPRANKEKPSKKKKEPATDRSKTMNRTEKRIDSLKLELKLFFQNANQKLNQILELQDHPRCDQAVQTDDVDASEKPETPRSTSDSKVCMTSDLKSVHDNNEVGMSDLPADSDSTIKWIPPRYPGTSEVQLMNNSPISCPKSDRKADSQEVSSTKLQEKTYPSLVVMAKPTLRLEEFSKTFVEEKRAEMDTRVKKVLLSMPCRTTVWLIQQGLVCTQQTCKEHMSTNGAPVPLKLARYEDTKKAPESGGYAWISDCCPRKSFSVFTGSIFEGSPHPPQVLLKLVYYWCCHTPSSNIIQWVKVDKLFLRDFFANMRAICTASVQNKFGKIGGPSKKVEVGVFTFQRYPEAGSTCEKKVGVLGAFDSETEEIRLHVIENIEQVSLDEDYKKILEPLEDWVDKRSIIIIDITIDKSVVHTMGFTTVFQVSNMVEGPGPVALYSNRGVINYLSHALPRVFQETLFLLSPRIMQQFLDELVWRERWGPVAPQAFDNIIAHLAELTRYMAGRNIIKHLKKIAANPFADWRYSDQDATSGSQPMKAGEAVVMVAADSAGAPMKVGGGETTQPLVLVNNRSVGRGVGDKRRVTESPLPPPKILRIGTSDGDNKPSTL